MSNVSNAADSRGRLAARFHELGLFAATTAILLTTPIPRSLPGWKGATALLWLICLAGLALLVQLANSSTRELHVVFARYLMLVTLIAFAAVRAGRAIAFGVGASRFTWPAAACAIVIVLAASAVFPRLRSFRESTTLARLEHERFLAAAESTLDDFYIFDGVYDQAGHIVDFRFNYINPNAERRLQVRREDLVGKILTEVRPFMVTSGLIDRYREVVRSGTPFITEVFLDDERIKSTWLNVQVVKLGDGIAITSRDITETRRSQERIEFLAHYDPLTGLANRTLLYDRLRQAILMAERNHKKLAVLMLDVDNFKRVNDTLGHEHGDALLASIAQRLLGSVRESDTVARPGGDEFVILLPEFETLEQIRRCGEKILLNVARPIAVAGQTVHITVSMGISTYPDSGTDIPTLLRNADKAMYGIKDSGRNGMRISTSDPRNPASHIPPELRSGSSASA